MLLYALTGRMGLLSRSGTQQAARHAAPMLRHGRPRRRCPVLLAHLLLHRWCPVDATDTTACNARSAEVGLAALNSV
jgi:hypothetical protein